MNGTAIFINAFTCSCLIFSFLKDRKKTKQSLLGAAKSFIRILPIVFIIIIFVGLLLGFVPQTQISEIAGEQAGFWGVFLLALGIKGIFLAIFFGALPTGPLYVAFPVAAVLIKKGAKISNIIIFLSAWACIKIPQEMVELKFLGLKFMALRLILTIVFVIIMGLSVEKIIKWTDKTKVEAVKDNADI